VIRVEATEPSERGELPAGEELEEMGAFKFEAVALTGIRA
jgi:hypothetical protein